MKLTEALLVILVLWLMGCKALSCFGELEKCFAVPSSALLGKRRRLQLRKQQ